ncbi:MAG: helix-turn-helix transcriptional regulator, partial [Pseudomonadota bacterium]
IDYDNVGSMFASMVLGLALICAIHFGAARAHRTAMVPISIFFFCVMLTEIVYLGEEVLGDDAFVLAMPWIIGPALMANLVLSPVFWMYVRAMTAEEPRGITSQDWVHFLLPLLGAGVGFGFWLLPPETRHLFMTADVEADDLAPFALAVALSFLLIEIIAYIQYCVYFTFIMRRLYRYRARLRDLFASTEGIEMRWLGVLTLVFFAYWTLSVTHLVLQLFVDVEILNAAFDEALNLAMISSFALWALREKPGLIRAAMEQDETARKLAQPKYEKSALTDAHARRIADKIGAVMEREKLYADPNLSLAVLSKRIGVSQNYVSQTLNETLGTTFFDYVNRLRVQAALDPIRSGEDTVLAIAYAVGFNSRSSFYKAFKKETGHTPSSFKAAEPAMT